MILSCACADAHFHYGFQVAAAAAVLANAAGLLKGRSIPDSEGLHADSWLLDFAFFSFSNKLRYEEVKQFSRAKIGCEKQDLLHKVLLVQF